MNLDVQFLSENAFYHVYDENDVDDDGQTSQLPLVYVPVEGYIKQITRKKQIGVFILWLPLLPKLLTNASNYVSLPMKFDSLD